MTIWRKRFLVYQRTACKSIIDDRGRAGFGENDLCQKKIKPFAEHDLRVTLECAGNKKLSELKPARDVHSCDITNIEPLAP